MWCASGKSYGRNLWDAVRIRRSSGFESHSPLREKDLDEYDHARHVSTSSEAMVELDLEARERSCALCKEDTP